MLWLPNDDRRLQKSPITANCSSMYTELKKRGVSDLEAYILLLEFVPHFQLTELGVTLQGTAQEKLFLLWRSHYQGLSRWLQLYLLDKIELIPVLQSSNFIHLKPYAKASIAYLEWSKQAYSKIECTQCLQSPEQLWYLIEASDFKAWVDRSGLSGFPAVRDDGKILGKSEGIQHDMRELREWLESIKPTQKKSPHPKKPREPLQTFDYEPTLAEIVVGEAEQLIDELDDLALQDACAQLLKARMVFKREISKGQNAKYHRTHYLRSPKQLHISGDGKRTPRPDFEPKKPPGRPRKKGPKTKGEKKS
ncbi:MAG: hypothetical protein Kow00121_40680 [Elainellaceae cyanobacterium]